MIISKIVFNYQIYQRNFLKNFVKKSTNHKFFVKFKLLGHIFVFKFENFLSKNKEVFLFPCIHYFFPAVRWLCLFFETLWNFLFFFCNEWEDGLLPCVCNGKTVCSNSIFLLLNPPLYNRQKNWTGSF